MPRPPIALLLALALAGCRSVSLGEFADAARRADIRCLAAEPDMTVASPFGPGRTERLLREVRINRAAIEALLEVEVPPTLVVHFVALEMPDIQVREEGDVLRMEGFERPSQHGIVGLAGGEQGAPIVVVYVAPEGTLTTGSGQQVSIGFDFGSARTIRHELTHVCARLAELEGPTWFDEGLALELEYRELDATGALVPTPLPLTLQLARQQHGPFTVDDVLGWEERADRVHDGQEPLFQSGRPLAHALMRFLLEQAPGEDLRERLEEVHALTPAEIRAQGPQWKAWLEELPAEG